jgi:hypothetical protein
VSCDEILAVMSPVDLAKRTAIREKLHALEAQMQPPTAAACGIKSDDPDA